MGRRDRTEYKDNEIVSSGWRRRPSIKREINSSPSLNVCCCCFCCCCCFVFFSLFNQWWQKWLVIEHAGNLSVWIQQVPTPSKKERKDIKTKVNERKRVKFCRESVCRSLRWEYEVGRGRGKGGEGQIKTGSDTASNNCPITKSSTWSRKKNG